MPASRSGLVPVRLSRDDTRVIPGVMRRDSVDKGITFAKSFFPNNSLKREKKDAKKMNKK